MSFVSSHWFLTAALRCKHFTRDNLALQRDGSSHGSHGPRETSSQAGALTEHRQSASVHHGTSLRPSHSFKDKRSSSAPVKPQPPGQLSAPPQLSHRHSLPTASKAISEETEGDAGSGSTMDGQGQTSNMTETISESMESLDGVKLPLHHGLAGCFLSTDRGCGGEFDLALACAKKAHLGGTMDPISSVCMECSEWKQEIPNDVLFVVCMWPHACFELKPADFRTELLTAEPPRPASVEIRAGEAKLFIDQAISIERDLIKPTMHRYRTVWVGMWVASRSLKTLKKLSTKDIKRQDTIWELINTEKQYVKRLKIMQNIFAQSMLRDMNFTKDQVDRLFPRLDELVDLHADFLRQLLARQAKSEDRFVEDIGDVLLTQFQDSTAEKMKTLYGVFCSKHTEAMQLYKEFLKVDRKFQNFAKKCTNLSVCEKRDISDFILGVTVRLSKYPILIEAILKSTKDKKDREHLSRALLMSKEVVQHIDEKVAAYEKLLDIVSKMDSRAVTFKNKKFKRQDLNTEGRDLLHSGKIGWKSARGRIYDVLAVVLTDIIVFLQKNEQKYTFLMQDNKSCVIPLYRLLIREKQDARDSLGIYMISTNHTTPEMYELVCSSKAEREDWIRTLQDAIRACPPEVESEDQWAWGSGGRTNTSAQAEAAAIVMSMEQERRRREEHANQIKLLIEQLHEKDDAIKACCDEKSKLMLELLELSTLRQEAGSRPNSQEIANANESVDIVQAAMEEASRLTTILQGSGTQLSRSVSSVGEHHSSTFVATPVPKRAETFAGFDSSHESPKMSAMKQKFSSAQETDSSAAIKHERSPSDQSLDQAEADSSLTDMPEAAQHTYRDGNTLTVQPHMSSSQHSGSVHLWEEPNQQQQPQQQQQQQPHQHQLSQPQLGSDRSSDRESLGDLSAASVSSLVIPSPCPSNQEQMTSIFHLVQYLNTLMNLTSKQSTKVESLRAELAEAKAEISKLSEDMQQQQQQGSRASGAYYGGSGSGSVGPGGRRNVYKHDQLEELRNLQENISRERQEWERVKLQDRAELERDRQQLEQDRRDLEKEKLDLRSRKEDLKRQREALQRQIDMMREQGYVVTSPFADQPQRHHSGGDSDVDRQDSALSQQQSGRPINHRRSASADFYSTVGLKDVDNIQNYPSPSASSEPQHTHQARSQVRQPPRLSVGSLSAGQQSNPTGKPPQQPGLPMHLLSARNEQRIGGVNVQRLPLKLSGGSNTSGASLAASVSSSALLQQQQPHVPAATVTPSAAFYAGVQQPFPGRSGGVSRVQSLSAPSRAALAQHGENSRSSPSSLAQVMKLADPKRKTSASATSIRNNSVSSEGKVGNKGQSISPTGKPPTAGSSSSSNKMSSTKPPAPQPGDSPGAPGAPVPTSVPQPGKEKAEGIIYF
ncbi:rho guanine nucleotide exchange factor 18 [Plakobranchus ocellatus]|uniref:Rho guanine nucleotide exchange factor 18 n=1 Tax=Plakobranchus ocellatus TaxID=259542 RepID=A0AAV4AZI7_9GAST|nr:rho guanine nucleotide exchange factor 18 [Plakobranchus ocellatus]